MIGCDRQVLEEMDLLSAFTAVLHVPNLNKAEQLLAVVEESEIFSKEQMSQLMRQISGKSKSVFVYVPRSHLGTPHEPVTPKVL
jgi:hypothetical protein